MTVTSTSPAVPTTITNLTSGTTPLSGSELVPIVQNGVTVKVTSNQFAVLGPAGPPGPAGPSALVAATSTTSVTIGTGNKTFATQAGVNIVTGQFLVISSAANISNYMHGQVVSYDTVSGALVVNVLDTGGSGAHADWNIAVSGPQGTSTGVSSVGLSSNASYVTVANTPVTTTGTITLNKTTGLTANQFVGTPNGSTGVADLRAIVPADLPVATSSALGVVQPDNTTITISGGTLTANVASSKPSIAATRNLKLSQTSAAATATVTADSIIVATTLSGTYQTLTSYNKTINLATTGAGGMDTGSAPASGFVSLYAIAKADGTQNILGCAQATSTASIYAGANMPATYVASGLIGTCPTNVSRQIMVLFQSERSISIPDALCLNAGTATSTTAIDLSAIVPTNAKSVSGYNIAAGAGQGFLQGDTANNLGRTATGDNVSNGASVWGGFQDIFMVNPQTLYYFTAGNGSQTLTTYITKYTI